MLDKIKKLLGVSVDEPTPPVSKQQPTPKKTRKSSQEKVELSDKDRATAAGEPYVAILRVDIDPSNINAGSFELDWNDKFVVNLVKSGYKQKTEDTDQVIVDRWFQTVCRNIALEIYEQQEADPLNREDLRRINRKNIGGGRSEVS